MKKLLSVLLALSLGFALAACGSGGGGQDVPAPTPEAEPQPVSAPPEVPSLANCEEPDPVSVWTVAEGITISLLQDAYPVGTERFTMVFDNRTDLELNFGEAMYFQKYVDGRWQELEAREDAGWNSIAYILSPDSVRTFSAGTWYLTRPLDEGLYRIVSEEMWMEPDETLPGCQLEFRIASAAQPEPDYPLYIPGQPVSGVNSIPVEFLNTTGQDAYVLDIPHLERLNGEGGWEEVPYREQAGFCGTPSSLPAAGRSWSEDAVMLWGVLEPGQYRLRYEAGPTFETEGWASGEFTVKEPEICGYPLADAG